MHNKTRNSPQSECVEQIIVEVVLMDALFEMARPHWDNIRPLSRDHALEPQLARLSSFIGPCNLYHSKASHRT